MFSKFFQRGQQNKNFRNFPNKLGRDRVQMTKGFRIYEEMREYLVIYEEAVSDIRLCIPSVSPRADLEIINS